MLHELDNDIKAAEATLKHWEKKYPALAEAAVDAKIAYELAAADAKEAVSNAPIPDGQKPPTVPVIEARATLKCSRELAAKEKTATDLDIAKRLIGIAETTLSAIQTRASLFKIEAGIAKF